MELGQNMEQIVVYPPNKPLEREFLPSKIPVLYQHLFFIDVNTQGQFITSCSNITGSYWEGTLFFYKDGQSALNHNYSNYFISNSSLADGKFISNDKILVAEDNAGLRLLTVSNENKAPLKCEFLFEEIDIIEKIAVWKNSSKVITCSGKSIHVWNINEDILEKPLSELKNFHTSKITDIDVNKDDESIFGSVSMDRKAVLWDLRNSRPSASVHYSNEFGALTAISFNEYDSNYFVVGSEGGDIYLLDMRQPKDYVVVIDGFKQKVHRLKFNSSSYLAAAADSTNFLVLECKGESFKTIYKNNDHKGFIRDFSWMDSTLFTCAFDGRLLKHDIMVSDNV